MGITVHDALSLDMRYDRPEYDEYATAFSGFYKGKMTKFKTGENPDGSEYMFSTYKTSCRKVWGIRWKSKEDMEITKFKAGGKNIKKTRKLTASREGLYKDKIVTQINMDYSKDGKYTTTKDEVYTVKSSSKQAQPMGPVMADDDWFPYYLDDPSWNGTTGDFYGTEHNAITNIISDNEAYIDGVFKQSGHINTYDGQDVDVDSSLLRTYTKHITTDADHVYISQDITETVINSPLSRDYVQNWRTEYTATFKKGRWKNVSENISTIGTYDYARWYQDYRESQKDSMGSTTSLNAENKGGKVDRVVNREEQATKVAKVASHPTSNRTKDTQNHR